MAARFVALVRSRRDAAEQMMNYDEMSETQKKEMGSDIELQNTFVEPLATRLLQGARQGVISKLSKVFEDRLAALAETRGRGERFDVRTYEELMAQVQRLQSEGRLSKRLTAEERIDWAYGNTVIENADVTLKMVEEAYEKRGSQD